MDGWRTSFSVTHQFADSQDIVFREHYILVEVALAHEASVLYETSTNTNKDILKYYRNQTVHITYPGQLALELFPVRFVVGRLYLVEIKSNRPEQALKRSRPNQEDFRSSQF